MAALRVRVLTLGRIWHASSHGSVVRIEAEILTARLCCSSDSVLSLEPETTTAAAAPSQLAEHIGPGVRVGDHDVVHDLVERHLLGVGGQRVERRVRVVLLADLGEELEARAAVLVAVLHADLGEDARHDLGADAAVDRGDRAVAAGGVQCWSRRSCGSRRPAARRRPASRRRRPGPCRPRPP